jgi:hypothetical protein
MKLYRYFPILILVLTCCKSNNPTDNSIPKYNDLAGYKPSNLNGKIKTLQRRQYIGGYENGDIKKVELVYSAKREFDENGFYIYQIRINNPNTSFADTVIFKFHYLIDGQEEEREVMSGIEDSLDNVGIRVRTFNNGLEVKREGYSSGVKNFETTCKYDSDRRLIEERRKKFGKLNDLSSTHTERFYYDDHGNEIIYNRYENGKLVHERLTEFDGDLETKVKDRFPETMSRTDTSFSEYFYYPDGVSRERVNYSRDGEVESKFVYNSKDDIETEFDVTYDYDHRIKYSYRYKYDQNDNWIEKIRELSEPYSENSFGPRIVIEEREFEYY